MNRVARYSLIGTELFLALTALAGAIWVIPFLPNELLLGTPFTSYTIPALALAGLGIAAAVTALGLWRRAYWAVPLAGVVGLGIAVFEVVETTVVGLDVWLHALGLSQSTGKSLGDLQGIPSPMGIPLPLWLQPLYFLVGVVMVLLAARLWAREPHSTVHLRSAHS